MLSPAEMETFWHDDEKAHKDNCFSLAAPQVALGIRMSPECVYAELNEPGRPWLPEDPHRLGDLCRRYNDKAEKMVGRRLLNEVIPNPAMRFPDYNRIGSWFGGSYIETDSSEWLKSDIKTLHDLENRLDQIEKTDLHAWMLPTGWEQAKSRLYETYGLLPPPCRYVRGPVTLAMSLFGVENVVFLCLDEPDLARRFSRLIGDAIIGMGRIADEEAGLTLENRPHGFSFADDNCCMLTPELYAWFGYPVLERVFDEFSPDPGDTRYQHSDSAMGHLLPLLGRLNLNGCNFGPTVLVNEIRRFLPRARIDGCLAPYTFMKNDTNGIIAQVRRDCEMARRTGHGLNLSTAGSINNGSLLTSMQTVMEAIMQYGRY